VIIKVVGLCCKVLFVDLDAKHLHSVVGDEGRIIPKKIQKALIVALTDDTGQFSLWWHHISFVRILEGPCKSWNIFSDF